MASIEPEALRGLIPPLVLPLGASGEPDPGSLDRQIDFLLAGGVDGLWVNGTSGDFFALSEDERANNVAAVVEKVAGRVPVIANAGDAATRRALVHARRALEAGADALAVVLPFYLDYTQEELKRHYRAVSGAVGAPVFLYQVPQMCKVALSVESIVELARDGTLLGVKDSAGDVEFYQALLRAVSREGLGLRCFYGASTLIDVGLYAGGHGVMSAVGNLVPRACKRAYSCAAAGDWTGTRSAHSRVLDLLAALKLPGRDNWAPTVASYKFVLRELGVIASDAVMEPLLPLSSEEQDRLRERAVPLARALNEGLPS